MYRKYVSTSVAREWGVFILSYTLKRGGFEYAPKRGKGSHTALYKIDEKGRKLLVIVSKRRELPKEALLSILQQANLSKDDFIGLLKK